MKKASAKLKGKVLKKFVRGLQRSEAQELSREKYMRNRKRKSESSEKSK